MPTLVYGLRTYEVSDKHIEMMKVKNFTEDDVFTHLTNKTGRRHFRTKEVIHAILYITNKPKPSLNPFDISDEEFEAIKQKNKTPHKTPLYKILTAFWGE